MICPRCGKDEVSPGTGLCIICATDVSGEEKRDRLLELIERDPIEFMRQAIPPADLFEHEAVLARLKRALAGRPDVYREDPLIRAWCDSKGHATEDGEVIEGGEKGWKRWLGGKAPDAPAQPEVEPDLDGGRELFGQPNVLELLIDDVETSGLVGERALVGALS
jgi:hypothetical protein